jgi:nucleoid-associated protein YgaU
MKRLLLVICVFAIVAAGAAAQGLIDNEFYLEGERLLGEAEAAFDMGDYDAATDLASQAEEQFVLSDEYVAGMLRKADAEEAIARAEEKLEWARSLDAETRYADIFATAVEELDSAKSAFAAGEYDDAVMYAEESIAFLEGIKGAQVLPARYTVILNPKLRDCLWRIAGLPGIYDDPFLWEKLYAANRKNLADPNNPDLILPGQVITVPSVFGEKREGMYDPDAEYEPLRKEK